MNEKYYSPRPKAVGGVTADNLDKNIVHAKRVIDAYRLSASEQKKLGNTLWSIFFDQQHKDTHEIFLNGELSSAAALLQNPGSTNMFYGFDNFCRDIIPGIACNLDGYADSILLALIRLIEALGCLRLYNPENPPPYRKIPQEIDDILDLLDRKFGKSITFPNQFLGEPGLLTSRGIIMPRDIQAIYQAWRIKQLVKNIPNPRILEIGAGLGRTAYYARQLGILDYTIVDIPFTCLSSGYFLIQTLGPDNVLLFGEKTLISNSNKRVKVFPPSYFLNENHSFDLILNADSLTEMDSAVIHSYWKKIRFGTKIFLSMNHELNTLTIQELVQKGKRIVSVDRKPYWMRDGYVEELIQFKNQNLLHKIIKSLLS